MRNTALHLDLDALRFDERGLLPVVVQDQGSGAVLMLAYANREALALTLATGKAHFWSRSRGALWQKGETSGNVLHVVSLTPDCDGDALLARAHPAGPTCHRGSRSCFEPNPANLELGWLAAVVESRAATPTAESYTARLLSQGLPRAAQKVGEEAVEAVIAALAPPSPAADQELAGEVADLLYHLTVMLRARGLGLAAVAAELERRHRAAHNEDPPS